MQPARLPDPPLSHIRAGRQTVHVPKCSSTLGIAIEGGANTKQPLPRIISIQPNGAAFQAGGLRIGQLIREVDGISLEGQCQFKPIEFLLEDYIGSRRHSPIERRYRANVKVVNLGMKSLHLL